MKSLLALIVAIFVALSTIRTAAAQTVTAVTNGGSFVADEVAPGSIAVIFGTNLSSGTAQATTVPWPTTLAGTTVRVNGANVPLYFVSPTQINFQVPNDVLTGYNHNLVGLSTYTTRVYVVPTAIVGTPVCCGDGFPFTASAVAPGIFTDPSGRAVVQNQDYSMNTVTNPAEFGSYITVYLTGIGAVDNPVADGAAAPDSPLSRATSAASATIGGVNANVVFLGLTPRFVGLAQANLQVPNLGPGTYPLVVAVGRTATNAGLITVSGGTPSFFRVMGDGVSGAPTTGSSSYTLGSTLQYSFAPTSGFSSAVVEVDGTLSPSSGIVTMNTDHWLWAFGQPITGTDFPNFITAPNDPVVIPYPQFYSNRPTSQTVRVTDPYCALQSKVVAYPNNYLGSFPMPAVTGAPLPPSILRGVAQLDAWRGILTNATGNQGCSGSLHDAFTETVRRVKLMGADHIVVSNYAWVVDATAAAPVVDYGQVNSSKQQISESELAFIVSTATAAGLDVWLYINVPGNDELKNMPLPTKPTQEWFAAFLESYTQYIVVQAQRAQKYGVKAMMFNWRDYWIDLTNYLDVYVAKMTSTLSQVHGLFRGKVLFYDVLPGGADPNKVAALYNGSDAILYISADGFQRLTPEESQHLTVAMAKQKFKKLLASYAQILAPFEKRGVVMEGYVYSFSNSLATTIGDESCSQCNTLQADFSVQAIAYEALFEAMAESDLTFESFETYGYWPTDVILPKDPTLTLGAPNIGRSVRNKPAEVIVQRWFQK